MNQLGKLLNNPGRLFSYLAIATVCGIFFILIFQSKSCPQCYINNDVLGGLYTGHKLLHGSALYVNWIELNPPSVFLMFLFSSALGETIGLPALGTFYFLMAALVLYALNEIRKATKGNGNQIAIQLAYLISVFGTSYAGFADFGEREHIFMILFLPYWIGRMLGEDGAGGVSRVMLFLVGFAAMMKPGFALMIVSVELWAYFSRRVAIRTVWPYLLLGTATPFILLASLSWQSLVVFFTRVIPSYRLYDHGDTVRSWQTLRQRIQLMPGLIPVSALAVFGGYLALQRLYCRQAFWRVWALLLLVSIAAVIQQQKYWPYHLIPVFILIVFFTSFMFLSAKCIQAKQLRQILIGLLVVWAITGFDIKQSWTTSRYYTMTSRFLPLLKDAEKNVLLLNYRYGVMGSAYFSGVNLIGPYAHLFTLSGIEKLPAGPRKAVLERRLRDQIRDRLDRKRPGLIIVEDQPRGDAPRLYDVLINRLKLLPRPDYRRISQEDITQCCLGQGHFIVYQRIDHKAH